MPEASLFSGFDSGPLSASTSASSTSRPQIRICACGSRSPRFKGYCEDCVKKLKKKFDTLISKFNKLKAEYDDYNQEDLSKADEKLKLLKNKLEQFGNVDANMMDIISRHEKLLSSDENRAFAEFKVNL